MDSISYEGIWSKEGKSTGGKLEPVILTHTTELVKSHEINYVGCKSLVSVLSVLQWSLNCSFLETGGKEKKKKRDLLNL